MSAARYIPVSIGNQVKKVTQLTENRHKAAELGVTYFMMMVIVENRLNVLSWRA